MAKLTVDLPDDSLSKLRERAARQGRSLEALAEEAILHAVGSSEPQESWEERWHAVVESIRSSSEPMSPDEAEREAVAAVREDRRERRARRR
jgi:plasmid stability protein